MKYLGLMSGTSLDGVDLALCRFEDGRFVVEKAETVPYASDWERRLREATTLSGLELIRLDRALGTYLGRLCADFVEEEPGPVLIASHGHTVFHEPRQGMTLQIGHGPSLRAAAARPVVYDFRSADVALGGQGAPLVPVADRDLFGAYDACLNLGGFANVTLTQVVPMVAFDICPCNTVLNDLANQLGLPYDSEGAIAASGRAIAELLEALNADAYFAQPPPKSLGREFVAERVAPLLEAFADADVADLLRTYTEHLAGQLVRAISPKVAGGRLLVTGGGALNTFLVNRMRAMLPGAAVEVPGRAIVDFKEAIAFAYLGYLYQRGLPGNIPSVTGASGAAVLGTYCP